MLSSMHTRRRTKDSLSANADIVAGRNFESAVVKVQSGKEESLRPVEKKSVHHLL